MPTDSFATHTPGLSSPPSRAFAISPDDNNDLAIVTRGLMVASAGDISLVTVEGDDVVLPALSPGVQYAIRALRIKSTDTTAGGIVGFA